MKMIVTLIVNECFRNIKGNGLFNCILFIESVIDLALKSVHTAIMHKQTCSFYHLRWLSRVVARYFNMHIQNKLLQHTSVMGTHSSYQLGCPSRIMVSS